MSRGNKPFKVTSVLSIATRWDDAGQCWERVNDRPEQRRPDMDFGTPVGDLIIDPWMQDIVSSRRAEDDWS